MGPSYHSESRGSSAKLRVLVVAFDLRKRGGIERLTMDFVKHVGPMASELWVVETRRFGGGVPGRMIGRAWFCLRVLWLGRNADLVVSMHQLFLPLLRWFIPIWAFVGRRKYAQLWCWICGIEVWGRNLDRCHRHLRKCDFLLSISSFTRDRLLERGGTWPPIKIVHPIAEAVDAGDPVTPLPPNFVMLTVARIGTNADYKGHSLVLRALRILKERQALPDSLEWRIVGGGSGLGDLRKLVGDCGLEEYVSFLGEIEDRDLEREYRGCSIFIMPTLCSITGASPAGEGFGIVYVEAANAGRASVASHQGGQLDIIEDGESGWLVSQDAEVLAGLLIRLSQHPAEVRRAGLAAHRIAVARFGSATFASGLATCIAEMQARSRA